jgi:hypothetical protein
MSVRGLLLVPGGPAVIRARSQFECSYGGRKFNFRRDAKEHKENCRSEKYPIASLARHGNNESKGRKVRAHQAHDYRVSRTPFHLESGHPL